METEHRGGRGAGIDVVGLRRGRAGARPGRIDGRFDRPGNFHRGPGNFYRPGNFH